MAKKEHISETPATAFLRKHGVAFTEHPYTYEDKGGTAVSARELFRRTLRVDGAD